MNIAKKPGKQLVSSPNKTLCRIALFCSIFTLLYAQINTSSAQKKLIEAPCIWLLKTKRYIRSAECFESTANTLPKKQKHYRGRMLLNAARLWKKIAHQTQSAKAKRYLQRSILLFDTYLAQNMCLEQSQCTQTQRQKAALCLGMGCGSLKIQASPSTTRITVRAGTWKKQQIGTWFNKLPPGAYSIHVQAKGFPSQRHTLHLLPRKRQTLRIQMGRPIVARTPTKARTPTQPRVAVRRPTPRERTIIARRIRIRRPLPPPKSTSRKMRPMAWVGYIGGGVLTVAGGILIGTGYANRTSFLQNTWYKASVPAGPHPQQALKDAEIVAIAGVALLGTGGTLLLTGILAHAL